MPKQDIQDGLLALLGSTLLILGIVVSVLVVATGIAFITMLAAGYGANDDSYLSDSLWLIVKLNYSAVKRY